LGRAVPTGACPVGGRAHVVWGSFACRFGCRVVVMVVGGGGGGGGGGWGWGWGVWQLASQPAAQPCFLPPPCVERGHLLPNSYPVPPSRFLHFPPAAQLLQRRPQPSGPPVPSPAPACRRSALLRRPPSPPSAASPLSATAPVGAAAAVVVVVVAAASAPVSVPGSAVAAALVPCPRLPLAPRRLRRRCGRRQRRLGRRRRPALRAAGTKARVRAMVPSPPPTHLTYQFALLAA
jgi:hypothetical protein